MASGSFNLTRTGSTSSYITTKVTWSSVSNGSTANTSTVTVKVVASKSSSSTASTYGSQTTSCTVDGTKQTASGSFTLAPGKSVTLLSKTYTVKHNDSGSKSCVISVDVGGNIIYFNGSKTVTLDTIPRYATSVQSLAGKTETSISMNWSSDSTIDYIWYSTNNGSSWTGINVTDGKSGTYNITGLSANTSYNIKTRVRRKDSQLTTDSSALAVTTYAYPYCNSMPSLTIGNKLTLGFYNPLKRSITVNIIGADNSQISNDTTTGTSISGYNNSTVVTRWYNSIPNSESGTYKVKVTYGSQVSTKTGGVYVINTNTCKPTISTVTYQDTNSTTTSITNNNQQIISQQSKVQFSSTGLAAINGATISTVKLSVNGNTYNMTVSGSSATISNIVIDSATNVTGKLTITDSRGLTASKSVTVTMLDWVLPTAIITLQRESNYYDNTDINVNADYSSIDGKNSVTIKCRYKQATASSYGSWVTLSDGVTSTLTLNNKYEWNVQVQIKDLFGTTTYNLTVDIGMPLIFFDRLLRSVGVNCFPTNSGTFEINGVDIGLQSGESITISNAVVGGRISNSQKELRFSVPLPQFVSNLTPSITTCKLNVRTSDGGYLLTNSYVSGGYDVLTDNTLTVTSSLSSANLLTIEIDRSSAWTATNNTPQSIDIVTLVVQFN